MTCADDQCPELNCADDELEGRNDDECCNRCIDSWVVVSFTISFIGVSSLSYNYHFCFGHWKKASDGNW